MIKMLSAALLVCAGLQVSFAQNDAQLSEARHARNEARRDAQAAKKQTINLAAPSDFNDTASFGKNAKFLGSLYAGTVFYYHSCDPTVLLNEIGLVLASDDHCYVIAPGPNPSETTFDDVWQITIPGKTVDNVVYPMLNNGVGHENFGSVTGGASIFYSPRVTIESEAFNDPAAIVDGTPLNGSFTTSMAGSRTRSMVFVGGEADYDNYASVGGRGFSRAYFSALGLPQNVIDNLFKKPMTLKFGLRTNVGGAVSYAQFFYTFRLLGN